MKSFCRFLLRFALLLCAAALVVFFHEPLKKGWEALKDSRRAQSGVSVSTEDTELEKATAARADKREALLSDGVFRYAYEQLSDDEKEVYAELLVGITEMEEELEIDSVDQETLDVIYELMLADHPEIFWTDGYTVTSYVLGNVVQTLTVTPAYTCSVEQRDALAARVEEAASQITADASAMYAEDYGRARYVYEKLIDMVEYDPDNADNQNICSVFLDGSSVCMGYAKSFQYLMQKLGIACMTVSGRANGETHAWDLVRMDDAYYYIDPTWGDTNYTDPEAGYGSVNYLFFGMTTADLLKTHEIDMPIDLPDCTAQEDNYYVREGLLFTEFVPETIGSLIRDTQAAGAGEVTFRFTDAAAYVEAYRYLITENNVFAYCQGTEHVSYREDAVYLTLTLYY